MDDQPKSRGKRRASAASLASRSAVESELIETADADADADFTLPGPSSRPFTGPTQDHECCFHDVLAARPALPGSRIPSVFAGSTVAARGARRRMLEERMKSTGFPYQKDLVGHFSCVNAVAFSPGDGRWMASAGDDHRILLRDIQGSVEEAGPVAIFTGPLSNVFSLSFSSDSSRLYGAGKCERLLCYDIAALPSASYSPSERRRWSCLRTPPVHVAKVDDEVREIDAHPTNPNLVVTASEDGLVRLFDVREAGVRPAGHHFEMALLSAVRWNPADGRSFIVAGTGVHGFIKLHDIRKSFRSSVFSDPHSLEIKPVEPLVKYVDILHQHVDETDGGFKSVRVEVSGLAFEPGGKMFAVNLSRYLPTVYATFAPEPLATLSTSSFLRAGPPSSPYNLHSCSDSPAASPSPGPPAPGSRPFYSNCCTIKHGSFSTFGGADDLIYWTGSDDFRGYGWRVPRVETLTRMREELEADDVGGVGDWRKWREGAEIGDIAFMKPSAFGGCEEGRTAIRPVQLTEPTYRLEGHRSIVNVALAHPTLPYMATAGIEKMVRLHSPYPMTREHLSPSYQPATTRPRPTTEESVAVEEAMMHATDIVSSAEEEEIVPCEGDISRLPTRCMRRRAIRHRNGKKKTDEDHFTLDLFDSLLLEDEKKGLFDNVGEGKDPDDGDYESDDDEEYDDDHDNMRGSFLDMIAGWLGVEDNSGENVIHESPPIDERGSSPYAAGQ